MRPFENYHIHTSESNIFYLDSPVSITDYANRATELGHKTLSTCNHGFQGNFLNTWLVAQKYGLKFVFAVEAYWVKDRFALVNGDRKDKTNAHIVLIAKDEIGRRQITRALTEASDTGYYYRPRFDLAMLMELDPAHVMITTACVAFWSYGFAETEQIVLKLWRRFGKSFYLELQAHRMVEQVAVNRFILSMYRKYGIQVIAACDSHYIYPEQDEERRNLQLSTRGGAAEDFESAGETETESSDALYMDYPDGDELFRRFMEQGVLPESIIEEPLVFSDLICSDCRNEYGGIQACGGMAYYVVEDQDGQPAFRPNPAYQNVPPIQTVLPREVPQLGLSFEEYVYDVLSRQPEIYSYLSDPDLEPNMVGYLAKLIEGESV